MVRENCKVIENIKIAKDIYRMILSCPTSEIKCAGQFIDIALDSFYLRRPISICDYDNNTITIVYKVVGDGTKVMAKLDSGSNLDCLIGLGNGFNTENSGVNPLVIGGGVGIPPLYNLVKKLKAEGKNPSVILGFNTYEDAILIEEFTALNCKVQVTTVDGSLGIKGFVTNAIENQSDYSYFYACGPLPMLKAISSNTKTSGQISMEERMGCGFGACMGCSIMTKSGSKRVCKDGPVFDKEDLIW
jgi:dihydroorotate dehydrogenase electron transfer subunit